MDTFKETSVQQAILLLFVNKYSKLDVNEYIIRLQDNLDFKVLYSNDVPQCLA